MEMSTKTPIVATYAPHITFPITKPKLDPVRTMKALEWHGKEKVFLNAHRPRPLLTEPGDVVIRITATTICGSDLHMYHNEVTHMEKGDVLGHEFMGIIEEAGPGVKDFKPGDRVVVSAVITDGKCNYCQMGLFSCCDGTNPSKDMEKLYGHRTAGIFGYSHLTGGYDGGQAEFCRVPLADNNLLLVPPTVSDEQALFLSDICCTGYHATELGEVSEGQTVAVWGCGPVGLMAIAWAKFRGAARIIAIDTVPNRLQVAKAKFGVDIIDFGQVDVTKAMHEMVPGGPDVCIDAVGFRFPKSISHWLQRKLKLETDAPTVLSEMIQLCRKGGVISVIGDYFAYANQFPIGAFMEKGLTMKAGQVHVQRYWKKLLSHIEKGEFDPTFVITHRMPLDSLAEAYDMFDKKRDNCIKVVLKPDMVSSK